MLIKAANRDLGFKKNANIQLESRVPSSHFSQGKVTPSQSRWSLSTFVTQKSFDSICKHQHHNNFITAVKLWHTDRKITDAKKIWYASAVRKHPSTNFTHREGSRRRFVYRQQEIKERKVVRIPSTGLKGFLRANRSSREDQRDSFLCLRRKIKKVRPVSQSLDCNDIDWCRWPFRGSTLFSVLPSMWRQREREKKKQE